MRSDIFRMSRTKALDCTRSLSMLRDFVHGEFVHGEFVHGEFGNRTMGFVERASL